jgi:hypothetical protein
MRRALIGTSVIRAYRGVALAPPVFLQPSACRRSSLEALIFTETPTARVDATQPSVIVVGKFEPQAEDWQSTGEARGTHELHVERVSWDSGRTPGERMITASVRHGTQQSGSSRTNAKDARQRSISPITMSSEPTMAGTSAIKQPRQSSCVTDRLQKQLLRARARQGIGEPSLTI